MEDILKDNLLQDITTRYVDIPENITVLNVDLGKLTMPEKFNLKYWDRKTSNKSYLAAGVDRKDLLISMLVGEIGRYELTKKDINQAFSKEGNNYLSYNDIIPMDGQGIRCLTLYVWAWAAQHLKWCGESKTVYGPAGQTALMHNHQMVELITDDMLVNGLKTSPRVIEEALEAQLRRDMEIDLGVNVDLPKLNIDFPKEIYQLTDTDMLMKEGKVMNHCVGGYKRACLNKVSYVFHVDDGTATGATVELCPNPWRVQQSMNYGNTHSSIAKMMVEEHIIPKLN